MNLNASREKPRTAELLGKKMKHTPATKGRQSTNKCAILALTALLLGPLAALHAADRLFQLRARIPINSIVFRNVPKYHPLMTPSEAPRELNPFFGIRLDRKSVA
jgi:hypothetical protein